MHQCPTKCWVDEDMLITCHHYKVQWRRLTARRLHALPVCGFLLGTSASSHSPTTLKLSWCVCGWVQEVVCLSVRSCNWRLAKGVRPPSLQNSWDRLQQTLNPECSGSGRVGIVWICWLTNEIQSMTRKWNLKMTTT